MVAHCTFLPLEANCIIASLEHGYAEEQSPLAVRSPTVPVPALLPLRFIDLIFR